MILKYICDIEQIAFAAKGPDLDHHPHFSTCAHFLTNTFTFLTIAIVAEHPHLHNHVSTCSHFHFPNHHYFSIQAVCTFSLSLQVLIFNFCTFTCYHHLNVCLVYTFTFPTTPLFLNELTLSHPNTFTFPSIVNFTSTCAHCLLFLKISLISHHFHFSRTFLKSSYLDFYQ